ncbi:MAG: hypothetical protein ACPGD5_03595 [Salibacteraceae bacterium]
MSKILVSTVILLTSAIVTEAKTVSVKLDEHSIRKDSLSTPASADTTHKVILFPNPFYLIIYSEEKKAD